MPTTSQIFVNQLTNLDFTYFDPEEGILGQTLIADIALEGKLNSEGMIFDFGHVKKELKSAINELFDHKLVFPGKVASANFTTAGEELSIEARYGENYYFRHKSPKKAVAILDTDTITTDILHQALVAHLSQVLPENIEHFTLTLREEQIDGAFFRYSHGLKRHSGACQRIAHGHRSKLLIFDDNNQRQRDLEEKWCKRWQGIYIGSEEDIKAHMGKDDVDYVHLAYTAQEGEYEIILPKIHCELINSDTTIELITHYVSQTLSKEYGKTLTIQAFEGLNKGSVCTVKQEASVLV